MWEFKEGEKNEFKEGEKDKKGEKKGDHPALHFTTWFKLNALPRQVLLKVIVRIKMEILRRNKREGQQRRV